MNQFKYLWMSDQNVHFDFDQGKNEKEIILHIWNILIIVCYVTDVTTLCRRRHVSC